MSSGLPEPTAQGDLARTPFAHALLYCFQRGLSGTLVVWPEDPQATPGQDRVRLDQGTPVAARLTMRAGALDRGLLPLFGRRAGPYAFYADVDLVGEGEAVRTGRVDPLVLIAASLRGSSRDDAVDTVLAGFGGAPVRIKAGSDVKRFELLPKELAFLDVVRAAPATIAELAPLCELGLQNGRRLLYLLAITKMLEPFEAGIAAPRRSTADALRAATRKPSTDTTPRASAPAPTPTPTPTPARASAPDPDALEFVSPDAKPAAAPPRPSASSGVRSKLDLERPPAPPAGLSPEQLALWKEVDARIVAIDTQSYFEMLEIPREAGTEAVRKAYFAQVKKWHPDRVPPELATVKPFVERIFQQLTSAHDTLCDEKKRGNYMRVLSDGGGTPESERKLAAIVTAAMDQQKAEVLLRRRDVEGAIALLEGALELHPDDPDTLALYAFALFSSTTPRDPATMLRTVDRALELNPKHDRAHYYRGMILRKSGREAEAIAAIERAAEINPKNVDAVREVRLAKMRGTSTASSATTAKPAAKPGEGSFFSKLFGGKKE